MTRSTAFALAAIVLASMIVRLAPLFGNLYWGSDLGEYYALLRSLNVRGSIPTDYTGWGITYPYFPGMFFVQENLVSLGGADLLAVLDLLVPVLGALAVVPIFLIAADVTRDDRVALFAAALVAAAMPHAYATSHTAPSTLGDLLVFGGLALFLRLRKDPAALALLVPLSAALVVTHHLSAYFLLITVLAATILRALLRPVVWSPGLRREIVFEGFLLAGVFAFWLGYAVPFRDNLLHVVNVQPWWAPLAAFPVVLAVLVLLVHLRSSRPWRYRPRLAGAGYAAAMYVAAVGFEFATAGFASIVSIPGTGVAISLPTIALFTPLLLLLAFAAAGRKESDFLRGGLDVSAWFLALGASTFLGTAIATQVLIPYRHIEYLVVPLAILAGIGAIRLGSFLASGRLRKGLAIAAIASLLAGTFASSIPSPSVLAGWDEGTRAPSLDGTYWARSHAAGLVAADHRASSILFGFAGVDATWDTTSAPFLASDFAGARSGLVDVYTPSGTHNVSYVWIDRELAAGVQLMPWDPAEPMSAAALEKFSSEPFLKVYDDGFAQMYWIDWGLAP